MIQMQTKLKVADNTGAKIAMCIKVLGGSRRRYARIGDKVVVSMRGVSKNAQVKRKAVEHAVVVRTKNTIKRADGSSVRFDENAVVVIDKNGMPKGTRVFGPIAREIRAKGYQKIVSQASDVI